MRRGGVGGVVGGGRLGLTRRLALHDHVAVAPEQLHEPVVVAAVECREGVPHAAAPIRDVLGHGSGRRRRRGHPTERAAAARPARSLTFRWFCPLLN